MLSPINKYLTFAFSISLAPSTPLTTLSYSIAFLLGSVLLNYSCKGIPLIYHPAHQPFTFHLIFLLLILSVRSAARLRSGPYPFNLYTTPLSTIISFSSISHLLYTDDIQLFVSFIAKNFPTTISDVEFNISLISSLMSFNFLTLNLSKTEFLLIGSSNTEHYDYYIV